MQALPLVDGDKARRASTRTSAGQIGPDTALGSPEDAFGSPLTRMALSRARMRAVIPLDVVSFVAACPACGRDCEWTQERQETRVRSRMNCPCTP